MSGVYLHGLLVGDDFIDVQDNIFSHSQLKEIWTGKEDTTGWSTRGWSWDYVTRKFVETNDDIIPIAQKWIDENLSTHKQLLDWIDRNWEGLVNGDEHERETYIWGLLSNSATHKDTYVDNVLRASTEFVKASTERTKSYADWNRANLDLKKADADWNRADMDLKRARVDWDKADRNRGKIDKDWDDADKDKEKARADWRKVDEDRDKAYIDKERADLALEKARVVLDEASTNWKSLSEEWRKAHIYWERAYTDWEKPYPNWEGVCADWKKADKKWKTEIMKPVFMELLKKYPNRYGK